MARDFTSSGLTGFAAGAAPAGSIQLATDPTTLDPSALDPSALDLSASGQSASMPNQAPGAESKLDSVSEAGLDDSLSSSSAASSTGAKDKASGHDPAPDATQDALASVAAASNAGAAADHSGGFAQPSETRSANFPSASTAAHDTPFETTAEAIRNAEPAQAAPPAVGASPAQEIVMRIAQPDAPAVDVHVTQRAGEVQVSVHTPDTALQSSLRQDLGTLVSSLQRTGYHAETFTPRDAAAPKAYSSDANLNDRRQPDDSSGRGPAGDPSGKRQNPQDWLEEMEQQS
jgi:hypothetical protein